jgi:hypothetical protein
METDKKQKKSKKSSKMDQEQAHSSLPATSNIGKKGKKINMLISVYYDNMYLY